MELKIKTNNKPRDLLHFHELPEKYQIDYYGSPHYDETQYFIYRNWCYRFDDFMRIENNEAMKAWHGYSSDSFFSGVVIKLVNDNEQVICGTYLS